MHIKHSILRLDPEANLFYFKEFDVLCQDGGQRKLQAIASIGGHDYYHVRNH